MTNELTESPSDPAPPPGPTPEQRARLTRAYQAQACQRADPLAANLGVMTGDLMLMGHGLLAHVQAALTAGGPGAVTDPTFVRTAELSLKVLRQIDRFDQLERRPAPAADPPSARVRPWREEPGI